MALKSLKQIIYKHKSNFKNEKVLREIKKPLDKYEKIISFYEMHPDEFSHEHLADSMSDLVFNSGIGTFLATICNPHNLGNPNLKLNDINNKWERVMESRNNQLINEEMFNEFKNDLDLYSNTYKDNLFDGLSLAKFFDEKIWQKNFKGIYERINELNARLWNIVYLRDSRIHQLIRQEFSTISPFEFEKIVGTLFKKMGYEVEVTPSTGDYGIDVIARKDKDVIAIQVKKYSKGNNVGNQEVQKLLGAMQLRTVKANKAILITTSDFTISAIEQAKETPIELWNGHYLNELLNKYYSNKPEIFSDEIDITSAPLDSSGIITRPKCPKCGNSIKENASSCRACKTNIVWKGGKPNIQINPFVSGCIFVIVAWGLIILVVVIAYLLS